jgi:hypothetical protein
MDHPFGVRANPLDSRFVRSYHPAMPNWRCPHCRTPQPEVARCWVCRRSSTSCATCVHYRRSVAPLIGGTCGLDPRAVPLRGVELRGCWRPVPAGRSAGPDALPVVDPLGPVFAIPGGIWADPEA